eukprot:8482605-Heterocapsa_arctica.AAC.1
MSPWHPRAARASRNWRRRPARRFESYGSTCHEVAEHGAYAEGLRQLRRDLGHAQHAEGEPDQGEVVPDEGRPQSVPEAQPEA